MKTPEVKRKLTAILSTDVEGYSRLMGEDEKAGLELEKAIDLYRSLGMNFWLPKAEVILGEVSKNAV